LRVGEPSDAVPVLALVRELISDRTTSMLLTRFFARLVSASLSRTTSTVTASASTLETVMVTSPRRPLKAFVALVIDCAASVPGKRVICASPAARTWLSDAAVVPPAPA